MSSMNSEADMYAKEVFIHHLECNLGDPALFPGTQNVEGLTIKILGQLFDLPPSGTGRILTGGSEANITALWAIRNKVREEIEQTPYTQLEIIAPSSAHISIDKAADLLGLKLNRIPVTSEYKIDLKLVNSSINSNTIAVVGVAGTTGFGTLDPLIELNEICLDNDISLHVDAAFGGLVFPFLQEKFPDSPTFNLESLASMTVDIHKMGRVPIPGGGLLWRDKTYPEAIEFTLPYLAGKPKQATMTGTRSGASAIAFAHLWDQIGFTGFQETVSKCLQNTHFLAKELLKRKFTIPIEPVINILGVQLPQEASMSQKEFHSLLWEKGWTTTEVNGALRFVIMPLTTQKHIEALLNTIDKILRS